MSNNATCSVMGCMNPTRTSSAQLCGKHYHRWYRHGTTDKTVISDGEHPTAQPGKKYRTTQQPDHPLAPPCGRMMVHRIVLFDLIGYGPHHCHWCGCVVNWNDQTSNLEADHLDFDKWNNHPENLVPACHGCNSGRAAHVRSAANRSAGWWGGVGANAVMRSLGRVG